MTPTPEWLQERLFARAMICAATCPASASSSRPVTDTTRRSNYGLIDAIGP